MDHEALEAELKKVEARARARRKQFDAATRGPEVEETAPWKRHQVKLLVVILALAVVIPFLRLTQLDSPAQAMAQAERSPAGAEQEVVVAVARSASGAGRAAKAKSPADAADAPQDPIENLLQRIQHRSFVEPGEVAVGPFLREFGEQIKKVDEIDITKLRSRRRGLIWTVVLAPLKTDVEPWEKPKPGGSVEVRCVKGNGFWRIEQLVPIRGARA